MIKLLATLVLSTTFICKAQTPFVFPANTPDAYDKRPMGRVPNRDATAITVLRSTVATMGGIAALRTIPGWNIRLNVTQANSGATHLAHWEVAGDQFRVEHHSKDGSTMLKEITTGNGSAAAKSGATITTLPMHTIRSWIVPQMAAQLFQQALDDPNYSIDLLNRAANSNQTVIRITNNKSPLTKLTTPELWYIDNTTMLPVQVFVRQYGPNDFKHHALMIFDMSNFTPVDGILIPFHSTWRVGATLMETTDVLSVKINEPIPTSRFVPLQ